MLRLRSTVLKLSASLSSVGHDIGIILNTEGQGKGVEEASIEPASRNSLAIVGSPERSAWEESEDLAQEISVDAPHEVPEQASDLPAANEVREKFTPWDEGHDAGVTSMKPTTRDENNEEQVSNIQEYVSAVSSDHDENLDYLNSVFGVPEPEREKSPTQLPRDDDQIASRADLQPQSDLFLAELTSASPLHSETWMASIFAPLQDIQASELEQARTLGHGSGSVGLTAQSISDVDALDEDVSLSIPEFPAPTGLSLPLGLMPATNPNAPCMRLVQSRLSEHVEQLEQYARCHMDIRPDKLSRQRLRQSSMGIMTLLTQNAWPGIYHKPTELQLTAPHSAIIDWVPYAPLRDRVIQCYNGSVALDRLMCEFLNSYVIEVNDVSRILPCAPKEKGYFGVWNLFSGIHTSFVGGLDRTQLAVSTELFDTDTDMAGQSMNQDSPNTVLDFRLQNGMPGEQSQSLSAVPRHRLRRLAEILGKPESALRLSYDIRLHAAKSWRLDRSFFEMWPELKFNGYQKIVAQGRSYRIHMDPPHPPKPLTGDIVIYHDTLKKLPR
ncbi:hypothetical protein FDECE_2312 [Fusarium decemcellulare]|nr:hypothetical protein FDECE_2312 [Fusarium decemcellulare]